jgi:hypothetical protein
LNFLTLDFSSVNMDLFKFQPQNIETAGVAAWVIVHHNSHESTGVLEEKFDEYLPVPIRPPVLL